MLAKPAATYGRWLETRTGDKVNLKSSMTEGGSDPLGMMSVIARQILQVFSKQNGVI